MDLIFLAFANSQKDRLHTLENEDNEVYRLLSPRAIKQNYLLHRDSLVTRDKLFQSLVLFRDHISILLYSGHAGRDILLLNDEDARAKGIAHILGQCPNLKLVVLNGCSTQGQVSQLLENGVPVVIATSAPVKDDIASCFSIRFFQALADQATIGQAFEMAMAEVLGREEKNIHRGWGSLELWNAESEIEPTWGIFYKEDNKHILDEGLPTSSVTSVQMDFNPNELLITGLMDGLEAYNDDIHLLKEKESQGKKVKLSTKRMAILNNLPAPIAEQLRKLMVPVDDENAGYDKISMGRLEQLSKCFSITMEFIIFTMLSQLWENKSKNQNLSIPPKHAKLILDFIKLDKEGRMQFEFIPFTKSLSLLFQDIEQTYFVVELEDMFRSLEENEALKDACFFLEILRKKILENSVANHEIQALCLRGEESLAELFRHFGFAAKYTLAAVNNIEIQKYRHLSKATFKHKVVRLLDLLGGLEEEEVILERFTDNQSVLLLKIEDEEIIGDLNLSPFIIDGNAFEDRSDVSKIYFYSHYQAGNYYYRYVNKPEDNLIETSVNRYKLLQDQLDAFEHIF